MDAGDAAAVLAKARHGDGDAFRVLVEAHSRAAFALAFRLTGNEQDAEDVVQESFLRAYRRLGRFESRSNFGTWLHRIVVNCSMDVLRGRQSRRASSQVGDLDELAEALPSSDSSPEQIAAGADIGRRVQGLMSRLTPHERVAFTLRHYEGRSIAEIGKTLGLQTSATKHAVFRAVKKLRAGLAPVKDALRGEL